MRGKCRIWWPKQKISCENPNCSLLLGWVFRSSSNSLDVVVAVVASPEKISHSHLQPDIEEILQFTNAKMPLSLQDRSTFSILGHCAADCSSSEQYQGVEMVEKCPATTNGDIYAQKNEKLFVENYERWRCGCHKLDRFLEQYRQLSSRNSNWIQFSYNNECSSEDVRWIPRLHHIHWDGLVPTFDVHVIVYEPPTFGVHHFLVNSWDSSEQVNMHHKRPMWVNELHQKQSTPDLDMVICAINSSTAAKVVFENRVGPQNSFYKLPAVSMLVSVTWNLIAVLVASFFTPIYIILQLCHSFVNYGSHSYVYMTVAKLFGHTWRNIHIRSCQLLYWPIFLRDGGMRYQSSADYVHMAALRQHSMWSSVAVDVFIGNIVGLALFLHIETACQWVLNLMGDITNDLLRSGCVWLMGVPAGFKLNTELAGIFGMISLNAIQIWSTLWFFLRFLFKYFIQGLAVSGIVLGVTVPAALTIDMIMLATLHVTTLHQLFSVVYSHQIQALTALWRLFRGRKWNPLRERFDSYNYTVKQHVVGSLLFTPLLLLLPTTSVFYIFFTILKTTTSLICILIEVTVSILHATPYAKIILWMVRRRRFPSGIWFEIVSGHSTNMLDSPKIRFFGKRASQPRTTERKNDGKPSIVVSILRSNISDLGQIILPHYREVFHGVFISSGALSASGVLTGKRIPTSLQTSLPSTMPWHFISLREYWWLCHDSVLAFMTGRNCNGVS